MNNELPKFKRRKRMLTTEGNFKIKNNLTDLPS